MNQTTQQTENQNTTPRWKIKRSGVVILEQKVIYQKRIEERGDGVVFVLPRNIISSAIRTNNLMKGQVEQRQRCFLCKVFQSYSCMFIKNIITTKHENNDKIKFCIICTMNNSLQAQSSHLTTYSKLSQVVDRIIKLIYHLHT